VADPAWRVELATSFLDRLESIEAFLAEAGADRAYDALLSALRDTVIPSLRRFPRMGRRYLDRPPQSAEAIAQLALLPAGALDELRLLGSGDYLIVYALNPSSATVFLLSIRHHRQLSFEFARFWSGTGREDV
jgi:plasmid stabilization system protein ParE